MMKLSNKLAVWVDASKETDSYWYERAKLDFAVALEAQLRAAGMNYSALAQKIGSSAAYITKVFRGDTNMTIESMVKLTRATGAHLEIRVVDNAISAAHWDIAKLKASGKVGGHPMAATATVISMADYAANHDNFSRYKASA